MLDPKRKYVGSDADLESLSPDEARAFLADLTNPDAKGGILRMAGVRYVHMRPEVLVNIQKQLERTVGASTKGFLYLAGAKSGADGLHDLQTLNTVLTRESSSALDVKRLADVVALFGWGRYDITQIDLEGGRFRATLENSPIAESYGKSTKPVCHLLAGWLAGIAGNLFSREFLCEETSCKAQGHARCEFEVQPMPTR